jgi:hypothetical protein
MLRFREYHDCDKPSIVDHVATEPVFTGMWPLRRAKYFWPVKTTYRNYNVYKDVEAEFTCEVCGSSWFWQRGSNHWWAQFRKFRWITETPNGEPNTIGKWQGNDRYED